jgi:hypothetical protein
MVDTRTRSGRIIKKPDTFKPTETTLEDDYAEDEHDTDFDSDIDTDDEIYSGSESEYDDEEEDDNGNLEGFVVDDESEEE